MFRAPARRQTLAILGALAVHVLLLGWYVRQPAPPSGMPTLTIRLQAADGKASNSSAAAQQRPVSHAASAAHRPPPRSAMTLPVTPPLLPATAAMPGPATTVMPGPAPTVTTGPAAALTGLPPATASASSPAAGPAPTAAISSASSGTSPMTASDSDSGYIDFHAPDYPPLARRMGVQGTVTLRLHISANGQVLQATIEQGSGSSELDDAAQSSALQQHLRPRIEQGRAVDSWRLGRVLFQLHADD